MVATRLVPLLRTAVLPSLRRGLHTSSSRSSGAVWTYRTAPAAPSKTVTRRAEIVSSIMWWWILYHFMTDYEHITGEFAYPDPSLWTDEELGIPPDDED
ncbi:NADH dehydrogenase [ubiquinone] 1 beta subcomplex subunit 2, mitochondrial-like [Portunus trituberculatus]|uniref:NADH dehydrogenase [ubiquinone] 1 beta subcomplex subunit 2, mitochondrial n=1 Tax=Portunus trituberculatus TaxID=210409 RepID=A0A5B7FRD8_PORTR|nr:NADH dehydrogenase [ubiquinone] 1 beta subcomplex subunit 2, mitochondrial-like [Portunus trituberculatus]MPC47563.1 NADH dehydrogenase [ubiquinone] 1 beta subcomplex subunit 2, mitochondrial [Portunus trituberculatus]